MFIDNVKSFIFLVLKKNIIVFEISRIKDYNTFLVAPSIQMKIEKNVLFHFTS